MSSIWHEMGIRDGKFCGVEQTKFLNTLYRFNYELQQELRKSLNEESWGLRSYYDKSFNGRPKWNPGKYTYHESNFEEFVEEMTTIPRAPFGTPITQEYWNSAEPKWEEKTLLPTLKDLLGEEKITYPARTTGTYGGIKRVGDIAWEKQQYRLVQAMRYRIVPLLFQGLSAEAAHYGYADFKHYGWGISNIKIEVPEKWRQADCKIGIFAKVVNDGREAPIDGCFWVSGKTPYVKEITQKPFQTASELRIYGAVDLATHPDYQKFFEI